MDDTIWDILGNNYHFTTRHDHKTEQQEPQSPKIIKCGKTCIVCCRNQEKYKSITIDM